MIWIPLILILPYIILLIFYYRNLTKTELFSQTSNPSIPVSVIIACHNEEKNITFLLDCLSHQSYPSCLFEVIVVNDNSTDKTFEHASFFSGLQNLKILNNKGKGKKSAIRSGIAVSQGDLILTTDADCSMGENWISTIAAFYHKHDPDLIVCPVKLEKGSGFFKSFQEIEFLSLQGITAGSALSGKAIMCNGANLAFSRVIYKRHSENLHDEINSGDDIFLLHSIKGEKNSKILWLESMEASVTTKAAKSISSFLQQRKRWISKGTSYTDRNTIIAGVSTFAAVLLQLFYLFGSLINPILIYGFIFIFLLKSLPDYLIIRNTLKRYGKTALIKWFLPSQLIYPFYVIMVLFWKKSAIPNPQSPIF